MRSSESVSLRFDGAPVIAPLAYRGLLDGVNNRHWSTLSFTAIFIGIAESLLDDVVTPRASMLQRTAATELHLTLQACRAFLRQCVAMEPDPATDDYRREVRDCKLFVTRALAQHGAGLFTSLGGSAYRFSSPVSRKLRDLLACPLLRPPVGPAFDDVFAELGVASGQLTYRGGVKLIVQMRPQRNLWREGVVAVACVVMQSFFFSRSPSVHPPPPQTSSRSSR
jgi:hypothetical protein